MCICRIYITYTYNILCIYIYTCNCRTFLSEDSLFVYIYIQHIFFRINCSLTVCSAGSKRSQTQPGQLDPADADIYLDALWGPLFFKHERIQRERDPLPRFSDYRMICLFLLLNLTLQLGIAFKIYQLSLGVSEQVWQTLFDGACWRVSSKQSLFGVPCLDFRTQWVLFKQIRLHLPKMDLEMRWI